MSRILVLVEGQTEEQFIKGVLAPHLQHQGEYLIPTIAVTKRPQGKPPFKGGIVSYAKVKRDILRLCNDSDAICITTMIDFSGLKDDFPGMKDKPHGSSLQQVQHLERALASDIDDRRFIPYLAVHEFEAMLFANPGMIAQRFPDQSIGDDLNKIRAKFSSPEDINDKMPPSKQLRMLIPQYQKPSDGLLIARDIGLERIRAECSHFNQWVEQLEKLGSA